MQTIEEERSLRESIWADLVATGADDVPVALISERRIARSQSGVYADFERTRAIDADGLAIGLRHTGKTYDDDLTDEFLFYHYPITNRQGTQDKNEIKSVKAAARHRLPVFVVVGDKSLGTTREVRRGLVVDWDDGQNLFMVAFEAPESGLESSPGHHAITSPLFCF